ncbi:hypothetical protein BaRGS_00033043, partial [Batillaria attramentaria]
SHFHFPTVNGSHLTVKENSTVTLPFTIDQGNCKISDNFSLKVSKFSGSALTQCWLTHSDGKCVPSVQRQKCTCASDKGVYLFTDVFDRSDNTTWVWSTDDHSVAKANLTFNVLSTGFTHVASSSKTLSPVATSSKEPRDTKEPSSVVMYVATIIAVVLVVGIISLSVTVICVKRATRTSAVPVLRQEIQLVERPRHPLPRHSAGSNESIHTYEEVRARPFQRFLSLAAAFRPASRRCQAPSNDPEDYLHPVPDSGAPPQSSAVNEQFL